MKLTIVAGARPNFMKIAPIIDVIQLAQQEGKNFAYRLVHTGQHFDANMSEEFFQQLGIPQPDVNLECGGGTQSEITAAIMIAFEKELLQNRCDLLLVVGDVTSTMACTIVAKKMCIEVAHVEAGIRSGDMTMPEEINRVLTDSICDYFFTTSRLASQNLIDRGISENRIHFVGNTMIDTLLKNVNHFYRPTIFEQFSLEESKYIVATLHRPNNVDNATNLANILTTIAENVRDLPVIFPVHPRTAKVLQDTQLNFKNLHYTSPQPYLAFNYLVQNAKAVITDSGGITEETTVLGIPCLTLRNHTERPETVNIGTNELIGRDPKKLVPALNRLFEGKWKEGRVPELWDGKTAERIIHIIDIIYNR